MTIYFDNLLRTASSAANAVLEDTLTKLKAAPDTGFKIAGEVIQGSQKQVIVEEAESWGADLIVMGSFLLSFGLRPDQAVINN